MGWVLLIILLILVAGIILIYNTLVQKRNQVKNHSAQIDTELKRRFDLIPNLIETVKGYATHEKELIENVTNARTSFLNASSFSGKIEADHQLSGVLKTLFAVAENYPDLKANTNFLQLQQELANTEDRIAEARQQYNHAVTQYNTTLELFPNSLLAGVMGFHSEPFFRVNEETTKEVPKVQF